LWRYGKPSNEGARVGFGGVRDDDCLLRGTARTTSPARGLSTATILS
jgi:hypothetical protein